MTDVPWRAIASGSCEQPSRVDDVHRIAQAVPHVSVEIGRSGNGIYQVGRKSFVLFRTPRPDAFDPETSDRYDDDVAIWVGSEEEKAALVQDPYSSRYEWPQPGD